MMLKGDERGHNSRPGKSGEWCERRWRKFLEFAEIGKPKLRQNNVFKYFPLYKGDFSHNLGNLKFVVVILHIFFSIVMRAIILLCFAAILVYA